MSEVANIYDHLIRFESRSNRVNYPIHKKLQSVGEDGLLEWIGTKVDFKKNDHVLDAGCGTGHSLFYLCKKYGISGMGISVSRNEIEFAKAESNRLSFSDKIEFIIMNYDEKLPACYDKIMAIESLKHSKNLEKTLKNLLRYLSPTGQMIVADDFLSTNFVDSIEHKKLWQAHSFTTKENLEHIIRKCGNFELEIYDLTRMVPTRSRVGLVLAYIVTEMVAMLPINPMKRNLNTYKGALLLEYLYQRGSAKYYAFTIKRKKLC